MMGQAKIKIEGPAELRRELYLLYQRAAQVSLAKWALELSRHILDLTGYEGAGGEVISRGFLTNEAWQRGLAGTHDVRQAGFKVHALARGCEDEVFKTALRILGQSVGAGHLREHAVVASDYAIKAIDLMHPHDKKPWCGKDSGRSNRWSGTWTRKRPRRGVSRGSSC